MPDLVPVRRALLSVSDKTGLVEFATTLVREFNVTLLSTGGTAKALRDAGLSVTDVSDVTGFPEMMDGRVKTLHPLVHGGLLAVRDDPAHAAAMKAHGIEAIDLVCINLYPFEETVARPGVTFDEAIEHIDIGGPSMVRSAAKNHAYVAVVTSPGQYEKVLGDLRKHNGSTCAKHRRKLATAAFGKTAAYDAAINAYLVGQDTASAATAAEGETPSVMSSATPTATPGGTPREPPATIDIRLTRRQTLRYGENPHQPAGLYVDTLGRARGPNVAGATQLHGKELSYINLLDADAALAVVAEFDGPAACVVKHATPCGVGTGRTIAEAVENAYTADPVAAFGGIVAINRPMDAAAAGVLTTGQKFLEVIVAPAFEPAGLDLLKTRWKNVRLLEASPGDGDGDGAADPPADGRPWNAGQGQMLAMHKIVGGYLVQARDGIGIIDGEWKSVGPRTPTEAERLDLRLAWLACKHVKSNAIVIAHGAATVGIGGGQVDRVGACRIAVEKAGHRAIGAVAASDAFFPFADGPKLLIDSGVKAIVQPGGSVRDQETIDLCNERGVALVFTGRRHFRH